MSDKIGKNTASIPVGLKRSVCISCFIFGCLFGLMTSGPGFIAASLGGIVVGIIWCRMLDKIYCAMKVKPDTLFLAGLGMGVLAGIADGIFMNMVQVGLIKIGHIHYYHNAYLPRSIFEALMLGLIFGGIGGFINGNIWAFKIGRLYRKKFIALRNSSANSINEKRNRAKVSHGYQSRELHR